MAQEMLPRDVPGRRRRRLVTLPLYQCARPTHRPTNGHAGLWFDKFCDRWDHSWSLASQGEVNPKHEWIKTVTNRRVGDGGQIDEFASRLMSLAKGRGGRARLLRTSSRFVTGLGRSHPVENGFAWHPTLGTPYLPGSSVKGLVLAWAKVNAIPTPIVERLLGSAGKAGDVCFLDAVPTAPVQLEADVMTPHYAGWTASDPPGDWRSPTPIPFLVTAANSHFLFGLVPRLDVSTESLETVVAWLCSALAWEGGGAKTSVGYGRFERDPTGEAEAKVRWSARDENARQERQTQRQAEERLETLSVVERQIEEILERRPDKTMTSVTAIVKEVEGDRWAGDDKIEVAQWLKTTMQREKRWKEASRRKNPAKDRDYQNTLRIMKWLREA